MRRQRKKESGMICKAGKDELNSLAELAVLLWKENSVPELMAEFSDRIKKKDTQFFLAYAGQEAVGFAQCQLRHDYVEGTETSPVGYLEGIFVKEEYRRLGYARKLLEECEKWAASQGCAEFASDCEAENTDSYQFHIRTGFSEANRIICFTRKITARRE